MAEAEAEAAYKEFLAAYTEWMLKGMPKGLTPKLQKLASKEALDEIELDGDADRESGIVFRGGPMVIAGQKTAVKSPTDVSMSTCLDMSKFSATSNGQHTETPRWFRQESRLVKDGSVWIVTKDRGLPAKTKDECVP
ncbi:hypothetical protein ACQBAR_16090 [Propionibacteriaceae bacterium Y1685]